jgi:hypothetical protein
MYRAGAINAESLICVNGEQEWMEARWMLEDVPVPGLASGSGLWQSATAEAMQAMPVMARRKRGQKNGCLAAFLFLAGLGLLLIFWPLGFLLIFVGLIIDHTGCYWMCGRCKNEVSPRAKMCPACQAQLRGGWW